MPVEPLSSEHLDAAAELLLGRLERERAAGLPWRESFVELGALRAHLHRALDGHDGRLLRDAAAGFIQAEERVEGPWLPSSWIPYLGHAARTSDVYQQLYAHAAGDWVAAGRMDHYVLAPAVLEDVVAAFFGLGFGLEHVYGIRALEDIEQRDVPDGVVVRRATGEDLPRLRHLLDAIGTHQQGSPVFGLNTLTLDELEHGHREALEDPGAHYWVALSGDRAVGFALFEPVDPAEHPFLPETTMELGVAAVDTEERGRGIGSAMTSAGLSSSAEAGFSHCITDWRSPNLSSSRTWARWGFRPYAYRLHRTIDRRLGPEG